MQIPFHKPFTDKKEIKSVANSIRSGWLTMGKTTYDFEESFKKYLRVKHAIAVNSCTSALHLALKCAEIKQGDEVIVPSITHASTAEVVTYFNAKPVLIDIEKDTHLIDASKIEKKITKKTKAIIPVHYAGQPVDIDAIRQIAEKYKLYVIEDAAHAFPAKYKDKYIGTIGHATCFSFYATKTITTGEGGMITTDNPNWAKRMRMLRLHGVTRDAWQRENDVNFWEYDVVEPGLKYNTTDINSAIGIEQLKKADYMLQKRNEIALKYSKAFSGNEGIFPYIIKKERESAWHIYPIKIDTDYLTINRNKFINELKARGIIASVHYIPLYRFTYYKKLGYKIKEFPASEWIFERTLSLPIYPGMSAKETDYIINNVLDIARKFKR
jgi:dTDP-4-amino-4,6-dideoxygalactose transaminase